MGVQRLCLSHDGELEFYCDWLTREKHAHLLNENFMWPMEMWPPPPKRNKQKQKWRSKEQKHLSILSFGLMKQWTTVGNFSWINWDMAINGNKLGKILRGPRLPTVSMSSEIRTWATLMWQAYTLLQEKHEERQVWFSRFCCVLKGQSAKFQGSVCLTLHRHLHTLMHTHTCTESMDLWNDRNLSVLY